MRLNGQSVDLDAPQPLLELLRQCAVNLETSGVAVAVNGRIVPRSQWSLTQVQAGDAVEVVHAVQGG